MRRLTRSTIIPMAVLFFISPGCAQFNNLIRPNSPSSSQAMGDVQCTPETLNAPNGAQRYVVEWNDGDRESLETEMHDGVALVKYTCDGIEVLRSCAVPGTYGYRASNSKKTRTLQISDMLTASANLSSAIPGAKFKTALEQGYSLNLAYVMIGSQTTPIKDVTRQQLENREACKEATHFVYQSQVGAFAMEAGEHGETVSASSVLGLGGHDTTASKSRNALTADGEAKYCETASPKDQHPPDGCGALMRVSIIPLIEGKIEAFSSDSNQFVGQKTYSCPPGTVLDRGNCVKPADVQPDLCEPGDFDSCEALCLKGSLESCNRMVSAFEKTLPQTKDPNNQNNKDDYPITLEHFRSYTYLDPNYYDANASHNVRFEQLRDATLPLLEQACNEEDMMDACSMAATMYTAKNWVPRMQFLDRKTPPTPAEFKTLFTDLEKEVHLWSSACKFGQTSACTDLLNIAAFIEMDLVDLAEQISTDAKPRDLYEDVMATMTETCAAGNTSICLIVAGHHLEAHIGVNVPISMKHLEYACYGGLAEGCFWSALAYASKDEKTCVQLLEQTATRNKIGEHGDPEFKYGHSKFPNDIFVLPASIEGYDPEYDESDEQAFATICERIITPEFNSSQRVPYNPRLAKKLTGHACYISDSFLQEHACAMSNFINL